MKTVVISFVFLVLSVFNGCQSQKDSAPVPQNKKLVRVNSYSIKYIYGKEDTNRVHHVDTLYNSLEQDSVVINYDEQGVLSGKIICSYDSSNKLISQVCYSSDGKVQWKSSFEYDSLGRLLEEKNIRDPYQFTNTKYIYKGDLLIKVIESGRGKYRSDYSSYGMDNYYDINWITKFTHNSNKKLIKEERFLDGKFSYGEYYLYDSSGALIESYQKDHDNNENSNYRTTKYDHRGNVIEHCSYNGNSSKSPLVFKSVTKYDDMGRKVETIYFSGNGEPETKYLIEYFYK